MGNFFAKRRKNEHTQLIYSCHSFTSHCSKVFNHSSPCIKMILYLTGLLISEWLFPSIKIEREVKKPAKLQHILDTTPQVSQIVPLKLWKEETVL